MTVRGIVTEQITPGEARNAFNDYLTQIRNGNGSEAIDKYFDAMTYIKLSFSDHLSVMNRNELEALREEFINYMKKVMSMPAIRKVKHKILEERIITNGFAEVKYLDAYGTSLEMEHTIVFRKTEGRLLYFDMRRKGQSMPKMLGKFYSQYSGELSPIAFIKTLNDSLSEAQKQSRFIQYNLKYGISVQIPKHWEIIDKQIMDQIDTNTELLSKVPQGDNDIIIAANYTAIDQTLATVRISVRTRNTFTQDAIKNMSQSEIDKQDILSRAMLVSSLAKMNNSSTKVSAFKTTKEMLSGFICVRTDCQTIELSKTMNISIYVIYQGSRAVKMTLAYENSHTDLLEMTMDKIKRSLVIKKL